MQALQEIKKEVLISINNIWQVVCQMDDITISTTKKDFEGDYTIVCFSLTRFVRQSPQVIAQHIGQHLVATSSYVDSYNIVQGFLNLTMSNIFWVEALTKISHAGASYGLISKPNPPKILVEYASPNTNKPLHLGHIRNILLGWSTAKIKEANGFNVVKTQIINDRGIAICKSMLAWQKFADGKTPKSTSTKGDHFVGDYYVLFEKKFVEEYKSFQKSTSGIDCYSAFKKENQSPEDFFKEYKNIYFNNHSALGKEARDMLLKWEAGDQETVALWKQMNQWVYDGFDKTYKQLGVGFDTTYYESDTYILGKKAVDYGLSKDVFYKKEDGSVWVNLTDVGMDEKVVLRSDGTSVYITQDIGTAMKRYSDIQCDNIVYVVADEQDYHFKVLFEIMKRLEEPYADGLFHLSYGMIDLPSGKMKSREGTVVDADDLMQEVIYEARKMAAERGELAPLSTEEQEKIIKTIGLGALKYFIIKVNPKKRMVFDPAESVDMQGQTAPYIQNAYVRIQSLMRKNEGLITDISEYTSKIEEQEKTLIKALISYPELLLNAGNQYDPSLIAHYCYDLAKDFHRFYHDIRILNAPDDITKSFRLQLSQSVGYTLRSAFDLLGIEMPERM